MTPPLSHPAADEPEDAEEDGPSGQVSGRSSAGLILPLHAFPSLQVFPVQTAVGRV